MIKTKRSVELDRTLQESGVEENGRGLATNTTAMAIPTFQQSYQRSDILPSLHGRKTNDGAV